MESCREIVIHFLKPGDNDDSRVWCDTIFVRCDSIIVVLASYLKRSGDKFSQEDYQVPDILSLCANIPLSNPTKNLPKAVLRNIPKEEGEEVRK